MQTKICSKCKEEKEISEFNKSKINKDSLEGQCKICRKKSYNAYYNKNKQVRCEKSKEWYNNHKEKRLEQQKKWWDIHKEERHIKQKNWYDLHKEEKLESCKTYRLLHKEKIKITGAKYRKIHKEMYYNYCKEFRKRNVHYVKEYQLKRNKELPDSYLAGILKMPVDELRQYSELLELKRLHIQLKRVLKKQKS
jgi:hypothetical protein